MANALAAWAAQPLRSVQDFQDADAERQQRGMRNALLQMQMQQARQGMADQQAVRNALSQHGATEQGANALMGLGAFEQAQAIQAQVAARQKAEAAARQEATKQQALRSLMPVQGIDANRVSGVAGPRPEALGVVGQRQKFDPAALIAAGIPAAEVERMQGIFSPKMASATPGSVVYDPATGAQRFTVPVAPRQQALPQIAQLQEYAASLPPGDPRRQQVDAVIANQTRPPANAQNPDAPKPPKPLPAGVVKTQTEAMDAIGVASSINADLADIAKQIDDGKLDFGPVSNLMNSGLNAAGISTEGSRNFASFKSSLERLRNESLRLNTGVQTDGDAQRAWNELFQSINDTKLVKQRLGEIQRINARAVELQRSKINMLRSEYGYEPMDVSPLSNVRGALGGGQGGAQSRTVTRTGTVNGRKVVEYSDGSVEYAK